MLEELLQESVPYISTYEQLKEDSKESNSMESEQESESDDSQTLEEFDEMTSSEEEEILVINMATEAEVVHPDDKKDSEGEA